MNNAVGMVQMVQEQVFWGKIFHKFFEILADIE